MKQQQQTTQINTMKTNIITKTTRFITLGVLVSTAFVACKKEHEQPILSEPTISNVELGLGNSGIAVIGEDFHFEMDVVAGDRIATITINIVQRESESYTAEWRHQITWEQYKGARNTNVHKHFDIPDDAPEGTYDFLIIVIDQNGSQLEETHTLNIYLPDNLPAAS